MKTLGDFGITDYTPLMDLVPRTFTIFEELGIINEVENRYLTTTSVEMERVTLGEDEMEAHARGADRAFAGDDSAQIETFRIPFFPLDKVSTPEEVDGFREWGTEGAPASIDKLVQRRIARIQRSHAKLRRDAFYTALIENKVHAKRNGADITALAKNFSTVWSKPRNTETLDLTSSTVDPFSQFELARQNVIEKAGDDADAYEMVVVVNSKQYTQIVTNQFVEAAYDSYASEQEPLRQRLNGNRNNRIFRHKGVVVLEDISGKIADNKCFAFPMGIPDFWVQCFSPANTIQHVNTVAEESYLFMKEEPRATIIESETSMAVILTRPELITDFTVTVA
ncbi:hypothetical protein VPHG_00134 [Vibrio phage 11895-B1]|uniref:hypothetical protein n=1 Tax=Vibrio phage 11895-B1 TaxID=754075 RepID=UPI0002C06245|nr:hypothetical protein VPHG_00134 [Vibrio phage 11895-B1]AGH32200.1 hypothetical protein VPHG_00134 [Vibrio phage 11895-B1]